MLLSSKGRQASMHLLKIDLSNNKDSISILDSKKNGNKLIRN